MKRQAIIIAIIAVVLGATLPAAFSASHEDTPTLASCGTSPTVAGTDFFGKITIGTGSPTACDLQFAATWTNTPHACVFTRGSIAASERLYISVLDTSKVRITTTDGGNMSAMVFYYSCGRMSSSAAGSNAY